MKKFAPIIALLLAVAMLFGACGSQKEEAVATIEGNIIAADEFANIFEIYVDYYGLDMTDTSEDNIYQLESLQSMLLDALINEEVMMVKAAELGMDKLTEEEQATVEENVRITLEDAEATIRAEMEAEHPEASGSELNILVTTELATRGYVEEDIREGETENIIYQRMVEYITANVTISDAELKAGYDDAVAAAEESYSESSNTYEYDISSMGYAYYTPAGVRRIKEILIAFDDEYANELYELYYSEGEDSDAYQTALEEALASVEEEAQTILDKLEPDGSNFEELRDEYNDDFYAADNPDGYYVATLNSSYDEDYVAAIAALEAEGDISGLIPTSDGYCIVRLEELVPEGPVAFEDVKDALYEELLASKQDEVFYSQVEAWRAQMDITINDELLASMLPTPTEEGIDLTPDEGMDVILDEEDAIVLE
ncbi:MAG: peptidyl-prolyl cis-trans isomerase [Christensenellaceae bacterium]|nr:peptidyl-prolyl cis-trans isomerase [Christensenellaceae bacterium]